MTNQPEFKPCADAVFALSIALYEPELYGPLDNTYCENLIKALARQGYALTRTEPAAPSSDEVERAFSTLERYDTFHQYHTGYDSSAEIKTIRDHIASLEAENKRLREALQSGNNTYLGGQYIVCIKPEIVEAVLAQTDGLKECRVCDGAGYHLIPTTGHGCCGSFLSSGECCGNAVQVDTGLEEQPCIACDGTGKESLAQTDGNVGE